MSEIIVFNGATYIIPDVGDEDWGQNVTDYLVALAGGTLQKTGGPFILTADASFGPTFGLIAPYLKSQSNNIATAGIVRLASADSIAFRNFANTGNNLLGVNAANQLTYNGVALEFNSLANSHIFVGNALGVATDVAMTGDIGITNAGVTSIQPGVVTNADINAAAAIAYSKLALTGSIVNNDIYSGAAIAYSKLALTDSIVNTDIGSAAAIAYSKLALTGAILNADLAGSIAYSKLILTGDVVNADIAASAAIAFTKLAALNNSIVPVTNGSGVITSSTTTATQLNYLDATSSIQGQINATVGVANAALPSASFTDAAVTGKLLTGYVSGAGTVAATDTILVGIDKLNGNVVATTSVANAALPSASFTDAAVTGKLITGFVSGAGTVAATDTILAAIDKLDGNIAGKQAAFSGLTTDGVIYATSATAEASTAAGTTGQFLQANTGAAPSWGTPSGSGTVNSGTQYELAYYVTTGAAVSGLTLITANRVLLSDANGLPVASAVTNTTLGYLDATSSIQTQLNSKAASSSVPAFTKWTAYTPTVPTNITLGNGSITGRYTVIGNVLKYQVTVSYGSTTSVGGNVDVSASIPAGFTISTALLGGLSYNCIGYATFHHDLTGVAYIGMIRNDSGTTCYVVFNVNGNVMNATIPVAYGASDALSFTVEMPTTA